MHMALSTLHKQQLSGHETNDGQIHTSFIREESEFAFNCTFFEIFFKLYVEKTR